MDPLIVSDPLDTPTDIYAVRDTDSASDPEVYHLPTIERVTADAPHQDAEKHLHPVCNPDSTGEFCPVPRDDPPEGTRMCLRCERYATALEGTGYQI